MKREILYRITLGVALSATSILATEKATEDSAYDKIWGAAKWVDNDNAKVLQRLALTGRLQGDAFSFRGGDASNEDVLWRRFRIGFKAKIFNDFTIHAEMDGNMNDVDEDDWDAFYGRLTDAYIGWNPSKSAKVKVGKQSVGFTLDGATSSKNLIVPERSVVAGNLWFTTEYFTGASVYGNVGDWSYKLGGYSASQENEFGHFESGYFVLLSAGYTVGKNGSLRLDYVYNNPDYTGTLKDSDYEVGSQDFDHVIALIYKQILSEKLGIWFDIAGATGISDSSNPADIIAQSDLLGISIMPFYTFNERFQLVFQYAGVTSLDGKSDVSMSRYASRNVDQTQVETTHNLLLGFNWYLYGHKLKWQNAVEYNYGKNLAGTGEDYNGYGIISALRISW